MDLTFNVLDELPAVETYLEQAEELADLCRKTIHSELSAGPQRERKPDRSWVTSADKAAEQAFRERAQALDASVSVLGEEFPYLDRGGDLCWVVDPIDGTADFVAGLPFYGTVIGLLYKGVPVVGVIDHPALELRVSGAYKQGVFQNGTRLNPSERLFSGPEDLRGCIPPMESFIRDGQEYADVFHALHDAFPVSRSFYTCYSMTQTILGGWDVNLEWNLHSWDFSASLILARELGLSVELLDQYVDDLGDPRYSFCLGSRDGVSRVSEVANALVRERTSGHRSL